MKYKLFKTRAFIDECLTSVCKFPLNLMGDYKDVSRKQKIVTGLLKNFRFSLHPFCTKYLQNCNAVLKYLKCTQKTR